MSGYGLANRLTGMAQELEGENMKKIISLFIVLLMASMVMAQSAIEFPFPVDGMIYVNGVQQSDGYEVQIKNLETGETVYQKVVGGAYYFNLNNLKLGYTERIVRKGVTYEGDIIRITACSNSPQCVYEFEIVETSPRRHDFNVVDSGVPTPEIKYVCWDGTQVSAANLCPVQPVQESTPKLTSNDAKTVAALDADYGQNIDVKAGNSKLVRLLDETLQFNDNDYDIHEEVAFKGKVLTSIDDQDYGLEPRLVLNEGDIQYRFYFDDVVDLAEITEKEPLSIKLLGRDFDIISAKNNQITFISGDEYLLQEGQSITVDGKTVSVETIGQDYIYVVSGGSGAKIYEGDTDKVNDIEVYVEEVLEDDDTPDTTVIRVGSDIKDTIKDGDDYNSGDVWSWEVSLGTNPQYIGIVNQQEYRDLDEEYQPLGVEDTISLPNNYLTLRFDSITAPKINDISFKVKDEYLSAEGDSGVLSFSSKDYDRVYVKNTGFYDNDKLLITNTKMRIGDSDVYMELGSVKILDLVIKLDMSDILYNGLSLLTDDNKYLDHYGIIFSDAENAIKDKRGFKVSVPDERPEAKISISAGKISFDVSVVNVGNKPTVVTTTTIPVVEPEPIVVTPTPAPQEPIIIEKPTEIVREVPLEQLVCADGTKVDKIQDCKEPQDFNFLWGIAIGLVGLAAAVLSYFKWGKGFSGLINYRLRLAKEAKAKGNDAEAKKQLDIAIKMTKTALDKEQAGEYKK